MTTPLPPGFGRGVPTPAREVSQTGNIGIPAALTDAQGRSVRDTTGAATITDSGYLINPALAPRSQGVGGLTPNLGLHAEAQVIRQALTEQVRSLQVELHNSLRPHTEAVKESVQVQRAAAQDQRDLTRALRDLASSTRSGTPGGTPGGAPGGTAPAAGGTTDTAGPNTAQQPGTPAAPAGTPARPGFSRLDQMERNALQRRPPTSAQPDPHDPDDPIAVQRQQVSALEERVGSLGGVASQASSRVFDEGDADQTLGIREGYLSGMRALRGSSARMMAPLARRLQQYQAPNTPDLIQDENGNYRVRGSGRVSLEHGVPNTPDRLASGGELEQFARGATRTGLVRGMGARLDSMGIAGVPGIGEAAIGLGVAHQAIGMYRSQYEQNRQFQAIEGGTNAGGAAERGRQAMFGFHQMGIMSSDQAHQLFQGATEVGFRGSERNNALAVATEQFRRNGTDIAQTLQLMSAAAETGGKQLTGVSAALNQVTDQARRNGQNAAQLRQRFVEQYSQAAQTFGSSGGTTATVAAADVLATSGQGERFANVSNAGLNSEMSVRMQAQSSGMQVGRYIQRAGQDPAFAERGHSVMTQRAASLAAGGQTQMLQNRIAQLRQQHPDGQIPEEEITRLSQDLANSGTFDPYSAARLESHFGITGITGQNAAEMIVRQMSGAADPAAIGDRQRQASAPRGATSHEAHEAGLDHTQGFDEAQRRQGGWLGRVRNFGTGWMPGAGRAVHVQHGSAASRYDEVVRQTGQVHPVVAQLLKSGLSQDTKVKVRSKGEDREVTLSDAVKYYSDQLDTGNVQITSGNQRGQNISAVTGGMGTGADPNASGSANDVKHQHGKKYNPNDNKGGGGTVTISPTPELQQILRFSGQGNVSIQNGRDTGTAPSGNVPVQTLPVGGN